MTQPVWKLCRILANKTRLGILKSLINGSETCVSDIATEHRITRPSTSRHIRQLSEHGLLQTRSLGKWLLCRVDDPEKNDPLRNLRKILSKELNTTENKIDSIYRNATAFTHERRGCIIQLLQKRQMAFDELLLAADISGLALGRHLKKLMSRGLVAETNNMYRLTIPSDPILKALLNLLLHS